ALARFAGNYRAVMYFDVVALGVLAGAMMAVSRRVRGSYSYADAFFPLVLVNLGHWNTLLHSMQVMFVSSSTLAGVVLTCILWTTASSSLVPALVAGVSLLCLPLCGANGVAYVPAFALWLAWLGIRRFRSGAWPGKAALAACLTAVTALGLVGLYFMG